MRRCEIISAPCIWANSEFLEAPYRGGTLKSTGVLSSGCLERANQLPSLLLPVSDINRTAAGLAAEALAVHATGNVTSRFSDIPTRVKAKYKQNE